ncbi:monocarboxylate transporter 12-B-like isoform X1 [Macrosteles quadrilineatus]|uniref:monocarboxylate transporter 12-B-like isoform X1 n=2 Tax=Macrosteles quadrilineatus TaxID=74068 RepID=UPI0023E295B7|nr:monocarboxylate transporter 12-B-like isoform X1 [Macrosteles quadrilineatus]XP_054265592.1 monocarboxylate transporter 12-B-like isoform X1 [Macrosteles quadrilineatus]
MKKTKGRVTFVPPDGGWGWAVVLGSSLINLSTRSIEPSFGLLFGDLLKQLEVTTTGAAVIMSTLDAVINFSGFFVGPLIKKYSYRKVGFLGAILSATALTATATASSMTHILLTYSLMGGLGFGLATAATFVALNSYFVKRRGQAVGLAMAGTALGFMAMPQVISRLLEEFDFRGTMLILGALGLHALVGAAMLQPVKWHMKTVVVEEEGLLGEKEANKVPGKAVGDDGKEVSSSLLLLPRTNSVASSVATNFQRQCSQRNIPRNSSNASFARRRKTSVISNVSHLDLMGSTMHVHVETDSEYEDDHEECTCKHTDVENGVVKSNNNTIKKKLVERERRNSKRAEQTFWQKVVSVMDFDLLLDMSYLNILFGLSITYIAELNFKLIIPFFMANLGYTKRETAQALSVMAIADITARIIMPPIYDRLSFSRRSTLIVGLVCVAVARSVLAEQTSWTNLMVALVIHGFFRGFALINFPLVISEAVVPEKFPAAFGLSMVSKGIFIVALGPAAGWIRDFTGSYTICLHAQSLMILSCVIAWTLEYFVSPKPKPKETQSEEPS